jgi:hypothetical protein
MLPQPESNIPLIGDWTTVKYNKERQLPLHPKKDEASSSYSTNKIISYKQVAVEESPQERVSEFFENLVTETIMYIDEEDLSLTNNDGWSIKAIS